MFLYKESYMCINNIPLENFEKYLKFSMPSHSLSTNDMK